MSTFTARQTFRETVATVAEKAKAKLPQAVNGRIEKAVSLVLQGDVEPMADGTITVYSSTDATRRYVLQGTSCTCADFERGQAPDGWCQHRIAAGIQKRVTELLPNAQDETSVPGVTTDTAPMPASLPEAPASVNCHLTLAGRQVQLTLRDTDETRLLTRLQAVLAQYPMPEPPAGPPQGTGKDWCAQHQVQMKRHENAKGVWYSHFIDGAHCKGKRGRA